MKDTRFKDYFLDIYEPLNFKMTDTGEFNGSKLKISNKEKILRLINAMREVAREL
jgi:hypothetical protein